MKFSWSVVMALSFGLFVSFMGYMVFKINTEPQLKHHLVTPNYYQEELKENEKSLARNNAKEWRTNLNHQKLSKGLRLFPLPKNQLIKVQGYRPSNPQKDFFLTKKSEGSGELLILDRENLETGIWKIILEWDNEGNPFRIEYVLSY